METIFRITNYVWTRFIGWMKDEKNQARFIVICFIISLIPLLILSFYNHPAMDDYNYGILTHQALLENSGLAVIPAVLRAAVQRAINLWNTWQGTYAYAFITALRPSIISEDLAFTHTWIILALFNMGFLYVFEVVLHRILGLSRYVTVITSCVVMTLCIQYVIVGVEAFYWWTGAIGYTGLFSVMLFLFGLLMDAMHKKHLSARRMVGVLILEVLLGGGMYPTGLLTAVVLALMTIDTLVSKDYKRSMKIKFVVQAVVYAAAFALNVAAPGNSRRQSYFNPRTPFEAIYKSYTKSLAFIWEEGINIVIILVIAALFLYMFWKLKDTTCQFRCPLMFTLFSYSMYVVLWVPGIYAVRYISGGRYYDIIYYALIIFLAANAIYYAGWLRRQYEKCGERAMRLMRDAAPAILGVVAIVCLMLGFRYIDIVNDLEEITTASALKSLVYGEAKLYDEELDAREELYHDESLTVVEVEPLTYYPELLYWGTLTSDPDNSCNLAMSTYYGKEYMIEISDEDESEDEEGAEESEDADGESSAEGE